MNYMVPRKQNEVPKAQLRTETEKLVQQFIDKGGQVQICPTGPKEPLYYWPEVNRTKGE